MMLAKRGVTWLLRSRTVNAAVRALACARGHGLVLVYHRIGPLARTSCEIVPTVPVDVFRRQLQALGEIVDFVTLDELRAPLDAGHADKATRRPAVAITFDDDLPSHVAHALPILRQMLVPAAFFLSGRVLHGLGPYWFQQLEALLITQGAASTARMLGVPSARPELLGLACEQSPHLRRRLGEVSDGLVQPPILQREEIGALSASGMTIGFHTLDHSILPTLDDVAMEGALATGRSQLAAAANRPVRFFAYPHGKVDGRSARAVRRGGFEAAFTGRPGAVRRGHDPFTIGRWEPGPLSADDLIVKLAMYLHRPVRSRPAQRRAS
jgi:peptidoglycan/xylan/chitin deacetylase (PgdA/CDA1 family)